MRVEGMNAEGNHLTHQLLCFRVCWQRVKWGAQLGGSAEFDRPPNQAWPLTVHHVNGRHFSSASWTGP